MLKPDRNMFPEGQQGDALFDKFRVIYNNLMPGDDISALGGYGMITQNELPPLPSQPKSFVEPSQLKKKDKQNKK